MLASFSLIWPFEVANFGPSELDSWQVRDGGIFKARPEKMQFQVRPAPTKEMQKRGRNGGLGQEDGLIFIL